LTNSDKSARLGGEGCHRVTEVFDAVHAQVLRYFPELVAELGGEAPALLARAGLADCGEATYRQAIRLLELAAAELHCPDFGLRLAQRQGGGGMFGPLGHAMRNSRTFGEALTYVSEHSYAHSLAARIRLSRLADGGAFSAHDILLDGVPLKTQLIEQIILIGHLAALEITGPGPPRPFPPSAGLLAQDLPPPFRLRGALRPERGRSALFRRRHDMPGARP
jgi:hypothetical protein